MNKTLSQTLTFFLALGLILALPSFSAAQSCQGDGKNFVDINGDGFNDNAPDHDQDGIPNGLDEDWEKPEDGTGYKHQEGNRYQAGEAKQLKDGNGTMNQHQVANQFKDADETKKQHQVSSQFRQGELIQNQEGIASQVQNKGENKKAFKNQMQQFEGNGPDGGKQFRKGEGGGQAGSGPANCDGTGPKEQQNGRQ